MTTYLGQQQECKELDSILQSLLQINGSFKRLNFETDEIYITIPKLDYAYILRVAEQNKTGKFYKFFSYNENDGYFKLGNIKVKQG